MAKRSTVSIEIARLNINANTRDKKTLPEMNMLTDIWLDDLGHLSDEVFLKAVKLHRQRSQFFPATADIIAASKEILNKPNDFQQIEYIPDPISKEELAELLSKLPWRRKDR